MRTNHNRLFMSVFIIVKGIAFNRLQDLMVNGLMACLMNLKKSKVWRVLRAGSHLPKNCFLFLEWKPFNSHPPKKIVFFFWNESPLKLMKNTFYFILKVLSVLITFTFLSWIFGDVGKTAWIERLEKLERLISKFMRS